MADVDHGGSEDIFRPVRENRVTTRRPSPYKRVVNMYAQFGTGKS